MIAYLHHVSFTELHSLSTLATELTGDNDLNTLGLGLHNGLDDTVASTTDDHTLEKLELQRLGLGLSRETTLSDLLGHDDDLAVSELESLLDDRGKFAETTAGDLGGVSRADDNVSGHRGVEDSNTGITDISELLTEELVELQ